MDLNETMFSSLVLEEDVHFLKESDLEVKESMLGPSSRQTGGTGVNNVQLLTQADWRYGSQCPAPEAGTLEVKVVNA